jgi:hypothetical protein
MVLPSRVGVETDAVHLALGLARLLSLQGDAASARHLYQESLALLLECNVYQESVAASLEGLAALGAGQGAVRLWGAAHALREAIGAPMHLIHRASYEQAMALAHTALGEQAFQAAWAEGRLMTPVQALAAQEQAMTPLLCPHDQQQFLRCSHLPRLSD